MLDRPEIIDTAQRLIRTIGHDSLLGYFTERLKAGKEVPSRPKLIGAYAQLAGVDAVPLLVQVVRDQAETLDTRITTIKALGRLVEQGGSSVERADVIVPIMSLLDDSDSDIRSAAAAMLAHTQAGEAVSRLRELHSSGRLNVIAQEEVRKFLSTVGITPVEGLIPSTLNFVGRHRELQALAEAFEESRIVALVGLGGIGKTALAAEFAQRSVYEVKLWLSCMRQSDLADLARELLRQVDAWCSSYRPFSILTDSPTPFDWETIKRQVTHALQDRTALLVIDDYETIHHEDELVEFVHTLISRLPGLSCLLVGRVKPTAIDAVTVTLDALNELEMHVLVRQELAARGVPFDIEKVPQLRHLTQGNPLLAKLAVELVTDSKVDMASLDRHRDVLGYVLERSLKVLSASQRRALELLAQFDEPVSIQSPIIGRLFEREQIDALPDLVQELEQSGLVASTGEGLVMAHTLVRDFVRQQTHLRTVLRTNQVIAEYYKERGNILRTATHLARADMYAQAIDLVADHLFDIINQGHAARAYTLLTTDLDQVERQTSVNLRRTESIGDLSELLGELARAAKFYGQSLSIARDIGDRRSEGTLTRKLAGVRRSLGGLHQAVESYEESLAIAREIGDRRSEGTVMRSLGSIWHSLGEPHRAIALYEEALSIARETGDRREEVQVLGNLATLRQAMGDYAAARLLHEQVLKEFEALGDRRNVSVALHQLGTLHQLQGDYERARERFEQSLEIAAELGDQVGVARCLYRLGTLYQLRGEYDRALGGYEQSLAIAEKLGDQSATATILHQLGMLHQDQGEHDRARECYEQSLAIMVRLGDRGGVADCLFQLGMLYLLRGEYGKARERYEQSLAIKQELGDRAGVASILGQMGLLLEQEGQLDQAVAALTAALALFEQLGAPERKQTRGHLARLQEKMGMDAFEVALSEASAYAPVDLEGSSVGTATTFEQVLQIVVTNTIAVLTEVPEKGEEWHSVLEQVKTQAQAQEANEFVVFLDLLLQLIEGKNVHALTADVPPVFQEAWEAIESGITS